MKKPKIIGEKFH